MANTYYIAATTSGGLSTNTGTSQGSPWDISKFTSVTFAAGDNILFNKGDTFTGTFFFNKSGTSGNPIIISSYGTGNNPILDGGAVTTAPVLTLSGNYVNISNLVIQNARHVNGLLYITIGIHDITIYNCYFNTGKRGINAVNCGTSGVANLSITYNYFTNIFDDLAGGVSTANLANGAGNDIQFNNCNGAGIEFAYNNCYTAAASSGNNFNRGVGDKISLYQSNGTASSYILVHDNNIRGGSDNMATGYIGITVGDVGGSYQHVYNNTICNSGHGALGIMPTGGTNLIVENNRAYGGVNTNPNNYDGMGFNDAGGVASCIMQNNHLNWTVHDGTILNKFATNGPPTGWTTNTADHTADPLATSTMLPDPLWTGTPWNSVNTYYIASASSGGLSTNPSGNPALPWTLAKLQATTINPGDFVFFHKGDVIPSNWTFTTSGTASNPITFDIYGSAVNNAELNGSGNGTPALYLNGCSYITIRNMVIRNCSTASQAALHLNNCHDISLYNCYTGQAKRGIYCKTCTGNIVVNLCWFSKFSDAVSGTAPAAGGGSGIQFDGCSGSGNKVIYSKFYTDISVSTLGVGDIINAYQCYFGTADTFAGVTGGFGYEAAYNQVRGGGSSPSGYAGAIGGDKGGSNQYIHDNIFIKSGAEAFQVQGGTNINMSNNKGYSPSFSYTFNGIAFANYSGQPCNTITIGGNIMNWRNGANGGGAIQNNYIDNGGSSTSTGVSGGAALATPTNWSTNTPYSTAGAVDDSYLPNPLFNEGDWNTPTSLLQVTGRRINMV